MCGVFFFEVDNVVYKRVGHIREWATFHAMCQICLINQAAAAANHSFGKRPRIRSIQHVSCSLQERPGRALWPAPRFLGRLTVVRKRASLQWEMTPPEDTAGTLRCIYPAPYLTRVLCTRVMQLHAEILCELPESCCAGTWRHLVGDQQARIAFEVCRQIRPSSASSHLEY